MGGSDWTQENLLQWALGQHCRRSRREVGEPPSLEVFNSPPDKAVGAVRGSRSEGAFGLETSRGRFQPTFLRLRNLRSKKLGVKG